MNPTEKVVTKTQRPSRKNIEWTSVILSFFFLLGVYLLSGQNSSALGTSAYVDETSGLMENIIFTEEVYKDETVRIVYFQGKSMPEILSEIDDTIAVKRVYETVPNGIIMIEGDEQSPKVAETLDLLRKST